jgi:hypothetical protein
MIKDTHLSYRHIGCRNKAFTRNAGLLTDN